MTKRELKQEIDQLRNDMAAEFVKRDDDIVTVRTEALKTRNAFDNAVNKPAEVRIEKERYPYIPNTTPWYQQNPILEPKKCYEVGGTCTNPHMDCINCPKYYNDGSRTYTAATREIPNPVEPTMNEE